MSIKGGGGCNREGVGKYWGKNPEKNKKEKVTQAE